MSANGQRIRDLRKAKSMGLRTLADLAGLHRSYLSRLERDIKGASPETLSKVAAGLEVTVAEITNDDAP